jgi:hypothetical protein
MENYFSSVYRQTESWLNLSNLWPWRRFCLDSRFFTDLGRRQIKIDASIALRLASSVNRRVWFDPNLEHPEKYAGRWFQPVQQRHFFFAPGCRNRESGGWGATGFGPCAARGLVSLWAALDSSRLWRVLGRPLDPLGTQVLFGMLLGALNMGASLLVVRSRTPR